MESFIQERDVEIFPTESSLLETQLMKLKVVLPNIGVQIFDPQLSKCRFKSLRGVELRSISVLFLLADCLNFG